MAKKTFLGQKRVFKDALFQFFPKNKISNLEFQIILGSHFIRFDITKLMFKGHNFS